MWNFLIHPKSRNVLFPFALAQLLVLGGSASTMLFFAAAIYVILLNPSIGLGDLFIQTRQVLRSFPELWVFYLFFVLVIVTSLITINPIGGLVIVGSYLQFMVLVPMAIGLFRLTPEINFAGVFSRGFRFAVILALFFGSYQAIWYGLRAEGWSSNALVFGTVCLAGAGLAVLKWPEDSRFAYLFGIAAFGLGTSAAFLTGSRGVLLTSGLLTVVIFFHFISQSQIKRSKIVIGGLVTFFAIGAVLFALSSSFGVNRIIERKFIEPAINLMRGEMPDKSISIRLDMQLSGLTAFKNSPIIGQGLQNVTRVTNEIPGRPAAHGDFNGFTHLHNDYLTHAVGGGIIMLLIFVFTLFIPVLLAMRISNPVYRKSLLGFGMVITTVYAGMAFTNIVFRHDILMTLFSSSVIFILIAKLQEADGILVVKIPDYGKIMTGQNPDGLAIG